MNKYGLIGKKLGHSYSKQIHEVLFNDNNLDATYELIEVSEEKFDEFLSNLKNSDLKGINVTIPYKERVIPYLDFVSDEVKAINACNTIKIKDGKLYGYNTDYLGFISQLELYKIDVKNKNVFILGSGGASKALQYALNKLAAKVTVVSRQGDYNYDDLAKEENIDIIVNATPVGMWPDIDSSPIDKNIANKANTLIDIIFNPEQTAFLKLKESHFNGLPMLIYQAVKAEEIWQERPVNYDYKKIEEVIKHE